MKQPRTIQHRDKGRFARDPKIAKTCDRLAAEVVNTNDTQLAVNFLWSQAVNRWPARVRSFGDEFTRARARYSRETPATISWIDAACLAGILFTCAVVVALIALVVM